MSEPTPTPTPTIREDAGATTRASSGSGSASSGVGSSNVTREIPPTIGSDDVGLSASTSATITSNNTSTISSATLSNRSDEANNRMNQPNGGGNVVKLNVGGCHFTTSRSTLCRFPGTFLETLFSGRLLADHQQHSHSHAAARTASPSSVAATAVAAANGACSNTAKPLIRPCDTDPDDPTSYFLDRDGRHFHHVLNYLRIGHVVSLPPDEAGRAELAAEADYYGLDGLVRAIRCPSVDVASFLTDEVNRIRDEETELRRVFATGKAGDYHYDIHHGLISLFASPDDRSLVDADLVPPIRYEVPVVKSCDMLCMASLRDRTEMETGRATCDSLQTFRTTFNGCHPNILNRLDDVLREEPIIIAGGSVLSALTTGTADTRTKDWWDHGTSSDVDLFVYGVGADDASRIARRVYDAIAHDNECWGVMRSRGVINFHHSVNHCIDQKVQIVLRIYDSPAEVLYGFDADCCCCAYDGRDVWLTKRCIAALQTGMNVLNPVHSWPNKASYELRLAKYAYRGFPVLVPGVDKGLVDYERLHGELESLKGLARLLKVSQEMESAASTLHPNRTYSPPTAHEKRVVKAQYVDALRKESKRCRDAAEILTSGSGWYSELYYPALVPSVYWRGNLDNANGTMWYDYMNDFGPTSMTRDAAWDEILDCESPPDGVPGRLLDSWDTEKRSREYLNGKMDSFDLDNIYYSAAYRE